MNEIDEMLSLYGLSEKRSILRLLDDFQDEAEIKEYCWKVLRTYPDLNKEAWLIGLEGGDYIYSFEGHYVFITNDIWSFNLIAMKPVLKLLVEKIKALKASGE
ncbi:hypothetical protein [Sphingobacterium siyangense]|uniref:hypothetical protein n=1 Tax=Sphingobacterium siyangense TaxID=459529 RepID=UPI0030166160